MSKKKKDYKVNDSGVTTFYDSISHSKKMQHFFEGGKITQIRFFLNDSDKSIKNKILILNKGHFTEKVILFYEKHFYKNHKKIIEYYSNDEMESYFEIEKTNEYRISKGFSPNGNMFSREKIEFNSDGKAITEEQLIYNADGTKTEYKISI